MKAQAKTSSVANQPAPETTTASPAGELVDMPEAIRYLKTTRPTFYRWLRSGKLKGMKVGRQWRFYRQELDRFLKGQEPQIELTADITPLLDQLQDRLQALGHAGGDEPVAADQRVIVAATRIIHLAHWSRASDIHIMPLRQTAATGITCEAHVELRIDGVLQPVAVFDPRLLPPLMESFKRMAGVDLHEKARAQDGRIQVSIAVDGPGKPSHLLDLRACFLPSALGETVTLRILDEASIQIELDRINLAPDQQERLRRALKLRHGMLLFTGPTGSGKTTVLYACMKELAKAPLKIVSVEDPVEYILERIVQVPVNEHAGMTFPVVLGAIQRTAPNVIMVGEVRDGDTAALMTEAALTGRLVLSSLHTNDAVSALQRLLDIGLEPFLLADSVRFIMAQRLVRRVCPQCSRESEPGAEDLAKAAGIARRGGLDWGLLEKKFRTPVGCPTCAMTGYSGRTIIAETLEVTPELAQALRQGGKAEELRRLAIEQGMVTLAADGIRRYANGETTLQEVLRATKAHG